MQKKEPTEKVRGLKNEEMLPFLNWLPEQFDKMMKLANRMLTKYRRELHEREKDIERIFIVGQLYWGWRDDLRRNPPPPGPDRDLFIRLGALRENSIRKHEMNEKGE